MEGKTERELRWLKENNPKRYKELMGNEKEN